MEERVLTPEEKEAKEYEKFKRKVARLTPYAHNKRMFSRMKAEKMRAELTNKKHTKEKKVKEDIVTE